MCKQVTPVLLRLQVAMQHGARTQPRTILLTPCVRRAVHTTAATIRPGLQVLRAGGIVSSVFFMCLADRVCFFLLLNQCDRPSM